jgi:hypothetical protein
MVRESHRTGAKGRVAAGIFADFSFYRGSGLGLSRFRGETFAQVNQDLSNQPSPAGLMAGPAAAACVAMEVFVERNQIAPMGISIE